MSFARRPSEWIAFASVTSCLLLVWACFRPDRAASPSIVLGDASAPTERSPTMTTLDSASTDPPGCSGAFVGEPWRGDTSGPIEWEGVAASPTKHGTIAAFTRESVHVSRDDGRTFVLLDATADPSLDGVRAVGVDGAGAIVVHRPGRVIVHREGRAASELFLPPAHRSRGIDAVGVSAGYIAVVSGARILLTRDYGHSWITKNLPDPVGRSEGSVVALTIEASGAIHLIAAVDDDRAGDYEVALHGDLAAPPWRKANVASRALGHDGTVYEADFNASSDAHDCLPKGHYGLCAVSVDGSRSAVVTKSTSEWSLNPGSPVVSHNETVSFALYGDLLVRLHGTSGRVVASGLRHGVTLAVDPCERVILVAKRRLVRWSQRDGWRIVR